MRERGLGSGKADRAGSVLRAHGAREELGGCERMDMLKPVAKHGHLRGVGRSTRLTSSNSALRRCHARPTVLPQRLACRRVPLHLRDALHRASQYGSPFGTPPKDYRLLAGGTRSLSPRRRSASSATRAWRRWPVGNKTGRGNRPTGPPGGRSERRLQRNRNAASMFFLRSERKASTSPRVECLWAPAAGSLAAALYLAARGGDDRDRSTWTSDIRQNRCRFFISIA